MISASLWLLAAAVVLAVAPSPSSLGTSWLRARLGRRSPAGHGRPQDGGSL